MNKDKKKIVVIITSIFLVLALIIGTSFALSIFEKSSDANLVKTGSISMHYTESSNVINITNALPMSDRDGEMQSNYFDFSITSDAKTNADDNEGITIPYDLIIEPKAIDSDKDALSPEQIKIFLTKIENGVEETVIASTLLSNLELKETNYNLYSTENVHKNGSSAITTKYRLRTWIDYNVDAKDWNKEAQPKQYKFAINVNGRQKVVEPTGAETIVSKVGTGGLVKEERPATTQLAATTDYRYTGANPDNYVSFNNELWRIIGVFDVDDGTGKLEKRLKIRRKDGLKQVAWNSNGLNDWTKATGMTLLNSGDYWNRTGTYSSTGLTKKSKLMIENAKWYLGGMSSDHLTSEYYNGEHGTAVLSGNSTSWAGKVGLIYPSDYGYATSGGSTTSRNSCLSQNLEEWFVSQIPDCAKNNWLYDSSNNQWTITPHVEMAPDVYSVTKSGNLIGTVFAENEYYIYPTVYLKSDVKLTGGTGTESDPYTFLEPEVTPTAAETIIGKVGAGGLVQESHPATTQLQATTSYRYTGKNPDNYVRFNNELWRIIGVFDVDDGTGNFEQRIKIIRNQSIGNIAWDGNNVNDWTKATGMTLLNTGDYWNRTGSYDTTGLTEEAKSKIADSKWYLGGTENYENTSNGLTSHFYNYERGTTVYKEAGITKPTSWVGKVGLMYPSDYGYATSGGTTTNRNACLAKEIFDWDSVSDCKNNDWLLNSSNHQWVLTPYSGNSNRAFSVHYTGDVRQDYYVRNTLALRPSIYLSSDIQITGGTGTESTPYTLS